MFKRIMVSLEEDSVSNDDLELTKLQEYQSSSVKGEFDDLVAQVKINELHKDAVEEKKEEESSQEPSDEQTDVSEGEDKGDEEKPSEEPLNSSEDVSDDTDDDKGDEPVEKDKSDHKEEKSKEEESDKKDDKKADSGKDDKKEGSDKKADTDGDDISNKVEVKTIEDDRPKEPSVEALRDLDILTISEESIMIHSLSLETDTEYGGERRESGGFKQYLKDAVMSLKDFGIKHGSELLKKAAKLTVVGAVKLTKLTVMGLEASYKAGMRMLYNFNSLKEDISKAKEALNSISEPKDITDKYCDSERINNTICIAGDTDIFNSLSVLHKFVDSYMGDISSESKKISGFISQICDYGLRGDLKASNVLLNKELTLNNFKKQDIEHYKPENDEVECYVGNTLLPGTVIPIAYLPEKTNINNNLINGYKASKIILGVDFNRFVGVDKLNYVSIDDLGKILDELMDICDSCVDSQKVYKAINNNVLNARVHIAKFLEQVLPSSDEHTKYNQEVIKNLELQLMFLNKFCIVSATDIHDYVVKVVRATLKYVKKNITALS